MYLVAVLLVVGAHQLGHGVHTWHLPKTAQHCLQKEDMIVDCFTSQSIEADSVDRLCPSPEDIHPVADRCLGENEVREELVPCDDLRFWAAEEVQLSTPYHIILCFLTSTRFMRRRHTRRNVQQNEANVL